RNETAGRIAIQPLRAVDDDAARVRRRLTGAEAAADDESPARARVDVDVDAVPVLNLAAEVVSQRGVIVDLTDFLGIEVVETADVVAAAAGKARIGGRRDAELTVVGARDRAVLGHREVAIPATEVADIRADPRRQLVLHAGGELPVVRAIEPAAF